MSVVIPESDWKVFRKLREAALERFCERVLGEIVRIASDDGITFHNRYLHIYKLIEERDNQIARAFNDPRRSNALLQLAVIYALDLVTDNELLAFTPATRGVVQSLSNAKKPAR